MSRTTRICAWGGLAALLLPGLLPAPAATAEPREEAAYWYDGARRLPLRAVGAPRLLRGSAARQEALFRSGGEDSPRASDGTFAVRFPTGWDRERITALEKQYGLVRAQRRSGLPGLVFYADPDPLAALAVANRIHEENPDLEAAPLWRKRRVVKSLPAGDDPLFPLQWHLENTGQTGGPAGEDAGLTEAWAQNLGAGAVIAVVDDGLDLVHPDLLANLLPGGHYDFVDDDTEPGPGEHGTAVAGLAAARGFNGIGVRGAAPAASLLALRILPEGDGLLDEGAEIAALGYQAVEIDIYNDSWGPPDESAFAFAGPSALVRAAMESGIREGREGKGRIYVRAAGNGGSSDDSNRDGYANSRYTIAVTASTSTGQAAYYAEPGSNILVNAPAGAGSSGMVTSDLTGSAGYNSGWEWEELPDWDYTGTFSGTSGAAPIVSGVVALMLAGNPALGWREVQQILAMSADRNDWPHPRWRQNRAGFFVSEQYGFGRVNAGRAVALARAWGEPLAPEQATPLRWSTPVRPIPDNDPAGVRETIAVAERMRVESVSVTVDIPDHTYWGDLAIHLTSPQGTRVRLARESYIEAEARSLGYHQWTLGDVLHLGENSEGVWTIEVSDNFAGDTGTLASWALQIHGSALPASASDLPTACDAASLSRPGLVLPQAIARGGNRHGGPYRLETSGREGEDYGLAALARGPLPVAAQLAVAWYEAPDGNGQWLTRDGQGWRGWNGETAELGGLATSSDRVELLYSGRLPAGRYLIWNGFRSQDGEIFACNEPLGLTVSEE